MNCVFVDNAGMQQCVHCGRRVKYTGRPVFANCRAANTPRDDKCVHQGFVIRDELCDRCCNMKGIPFEVFSCALHTECSAIKLHSKVRSCRACEDYQPEKTSEKT